MLRFGTISKIDADKGLAKVQFKEDGIETDWLPVLQRNTKKNKHFHIPDTDEHVACVMDENAENGVILGAVYSKNENPGGVKGADKVGVEFESGDAIEYDRGSRKLKVKTGTTEVHVAPAGPTVKKGGESLKTILMDLLTELISETHPTPVGPTSPPTNAPAYTAIKTRVENFFEN